MAMTPQQRAAKTRKQNRAYMRLYLEVTKPANEKVESLVNGFLAKEVVAVRFVSRNDGYKLKGGVTTARLLKVDHGGLGFTVLIDGYKQPKHYASSFWELSKEVRNED